MRLTYALFAAAFLIAGCSKTENDEMATPPADTSTMPNTTTEPSPTPPPDESLPPSSDPATTDMPPSDTPPPPAP